MNRARLVLQLLGRRGGAYRLGRRVGRRVGGRETQLKNLNQPYSNHNKKQKGSKKDTSIQVHDGGTHGRPGRQGKEERRAYRVCMPTT